MEKRRTIFPGGEEVISKKRRAKSPPPISNIPRPKTVERTSLGPSLPVKIRKPDVVLSESVWKHYKPILTEDQAGAVTVAYKVHPEFPIFAIKSFKAPSDSISRILQCCHPNTVALMQIYFWEDEFNFVYEPMMVSLEDIQVTPCDDFVAPEIAAVCVDVLHGLKYIHEALNIVHGAVNTSNILLGNDGCLKLANVGESMLKNGREPKQVDVQALGHVMVHLMEPECTKDQAQRLELQHQSKWNDDIRKFLARTSKDSLGRLMEDTFLKTSPGSMCLKPRVLIAERSLGRDWNICI